MTKPYLVISIDTEEGFDWSKPFRRDNYITQTLFDHDFYMTGFYNAYNVRPISLVSYPLLIEYDCQRLLKKYATENRYILGTHLHSWVTPPHLEELSDFNSFANNLPADLEFQKLKILTDKFIEIIGYQPLCYKAGRYGVSTRSFEFLQQLGYHYDFSPFAKCSYTHELGPDFTHIDNKPYLPLSDKPLICYPGTADYTGYFKNNSFATRVFRNKIVTFLKGRAISSRLNLLDFIPLTPEGVTENEMKHLTRSLIADGQRYFHLSYHASSFTVGGSPYAKTQKDIEIIATRLKNYIHFFQEIGGKTDISLERLSVLK
jgi:hypothetical protein